MTEALLSKGDFLRFFDQGSEDLHQFLNSVTPQQMTEPTDAAGWTVKDHLAHLAVWANGMLAAIQHQPRITAMGLTDWEPFDVMNEKIRQQHAGDDLESVLRFLAATHNKLALQLAGMSNEDLQRPYNYYQPDSDRELPILMWLIGNTWGHYEEHLPWMAKIAGVPYHMPQLALVLEIQGAWEELHEFVETLTAEQLTRPTDAAGWTVKDHLAHLAAWEEALLAIVQGAQPHERLKVPKEVYDRFNFDEINALLYQQHRAKSVTEVQTWHAKTHEDLLKIIGGFTNADLQRPVASFQPDSPTRTEPISGWLNIAYEHLHEHLPWMQAIAARVVPEPNPPTLRYTLDTIQQAWDELQFFVRGLNEQQLTTPTDAAGWTVKDHLAHIAEWERVTVAVLNGQPMRVAADIPEAVWNGPDPNEVNAIIQQRFKDKTWQQVRKLLRSQHKALLARLEKLTDADLVRPFSDFVPSSNASHPLIATIRGSADQHYREHIPWMKAIVGA